jgi:hypothetical protein
MKAGSWLLVRAALPAAVHGQASALKSVHLSLQLELGVKALATQIKGSMQRVGPSWWLGTTALPGKHHLQALCV